MVKLYKFMHSRDVPHLLNGKLLFRDYRHFQTMEFPIGDYNEGRHLGVAEGPYHGNDGRFPLGPMFEVPAGNVLNIENIVIENVTADSLISCYAAGQLEDLAATMLGGNDGYDAAVEILDSQLLVDALHRTGRFKTGEFCRNTHRPSGDSVRYVEIKFPDNDGHLKHLMFRKHPDYAHQREYRLLLAHLGGAYTEQIDHDPVFVQTSGYEWILKRVI